MIKEFKQFALRGNVLDLAVGVIIGGAFGKIVTSFVNDILMPPIGLLLGKVNFSNLYLVIQGEIPAGTSLSEAANMPGVVTWNYGLFLNNVVDFLVIAVTIFLLIRAINQMKKPEPPAKKPCPYCLSDIPQQATRCPHCTSVI